jgi:hypothetical protein
VCADEGDNLIVWGEVVSEDAVSAHRRDQLTQKPALLVWTTPPDAATWEHVLDTVQPKRAYLFGADPPTDAPEPFLKRLGGLVKYALREKNGMVSVAQLAALTAQREQTVRAGLAWLAAKGKITVTEGENNTLMLSSGGEATDPNGAMARLKRLLEESTAYRRHWLRADVSALQN